MKSRALWIFVVAVVLVLAAVWLWRSQTAAPAPAAHPAGASSAIPGAAAPKSKPEVPIEDGKTIDFSSGVPIVKDDAKEKAAIDRSVKAMEEAAKDVTFGPPPVTKDAGFGPPPATKDAGFGPPSAATTTTTAEPAKK